MAGLADMMAGPSTQSSQTQSVPSVEEVVALLMQGIPPDELISMGIPEQLLMEAIATLEQQMAAEQAAAQAGPQGLAGTLVGQ